MRTKQEIKIRLDHARRQLNLVERLSDDSGKNLFVVVDRREVITALTREITALRWVLAEVDEMPAHIPDYYDRIWRREVENDSTAQ